MEDGFETGKITGIVLVDLSAAYDAAYCSGPPAAN